jgi:Restriction endonuclease
MTFAAAAEELRRQEFARLAAYVTPRLEQLRSMTIGEIRIENALMWERLGHTLHTHPDAPELVTTRSERKFIIICANPADRAPASSVALRHLRDRVVTIGAERGFYVSVRGFTPEARHFTGAAPVQAIDGEEFIRALHRSRKGMLLPQTYKAMCRDCGGIVHYSLSTDETQRCGGGHFVPPTIARDDLIKPRPPQPARPGPGSPAPAPQPKIIRPRNMTPKAQRRRAIKAHNYKLRAHGLRHHQTTQ